MSNLEMRIYTAFDGVEATVTWANRAEYEAVKKFLEDAGASVAGISLSDAPRDSEFVYVGKREQIEGLSEFVKLLRQKSGSYS
jgi:hypothetical protein